MAINPTGLKQGIIILTGSFADASLRWLTASVWLLVNSALIGCATEELQHESLSGCSKRSADHSIPLGSGADPSIAFADGLYHYVQSSSDARSITIRQSRSLSTLATQSSTTVWEGGVQGVPCCDLWAPELKYLRGKWYIFFAADHGDNASHRLYVIEANRPEGPYALKGSINTPGGHWSIDGTAFESPSGDLYLLWSGWPGAVDGQQNIYIARMENPWTVLPPAALISAPYHAWETFGSPPRVNEGPAALIHGDRVFVTYSASGCWTPDYSLGLLTAQLGSNLLQVKSWHKSPEPVFHRNDRDHIYGTGHNGFFHSPDQREDWIVYHAVNDPHGSCGRDRSVRAQRLAWSPDGAPEFGLALPPSPSGTLPAGDPQERCATR